MEETREGTVARCLLVITFLRFLFFILSLIKINVTLRMPEQMAVNLRAQTSKGHLN